MASPPERSIADEVTIHDEQQTPPPSEHGDRIAEFETKVKLLEKQLAESEATNAEFKKMESHRNRVIIELQEQVNLLSNEKTELTKAFDNLSSQ